MADMPKSKQEVIQQYGTAGQVFIESFNHVRAAVMAMGGKPTSAAFRDIQKLAIDMAKNAEALAGLMKIGEDAIKAGKNGKGINKFIPKPIDPTAEML